MRVAVLVSGGGTTLQNFVNERDRGRLGIEIVHVVSSQKRAFALTRAQRAGLSYEVIEQSQVADEDAWSAAVIEACEAKGASMICMAGFRRFLRIPDRWLGRVLNIHSSLLPAFGGRGMYGDRVHEAVLGYGARVSGCTVHVADNTLDGGPVVVQRSVPVLFDDTPETLRARVYHEECLAYPLALRLFSEGRVRFGGRRVELDAPRS